MKKLLLPLTLVALVAATGWLALKKSERQTHLVVRTAPETSPLEIALTPLSGAAKIDREIADTQEKIRHSPDAAPLIERLGWSFVTKARLSCDPGFYKLAEKAADALAQKQPDDAGVLLLRGHIFHALHRFTEAEAMARQLVAKREFVFDYALLGDALMEQGKLNDAVVAYQKMVDLKPCLQTYSRVAHMRWLKGDLPGALVAMRLAVTGGSPREPEPVAWANTRLALYELQAGEPGAAIRSTELALQFVPDYAPALLARGRIELAQEKNSDAMRTLQQAAQENPLPEYEWTLADALRAGGKSADADAIETRLRERGAANDPRTFALFLASRGETPKEALQLAQEELAARQDVFTRDALAWAQKQNGRLADAAENSKLALAEGTQDARLFYHAGSIAAASGRANEASELLRKADQIRQMLLPSERQELAKQLAAISPQLSFNQQQNSSRKTQ